MRAMLCCVTAVSLCQMALASEPRWKRMKLDEVFRSEGVAVADINQDGKLDVIHGEGWYESASPTLRAIRKLSDYGDGSAGYSHSFANFAYDINRDGWVDLICIDFPGIPCYWFENPKGQEGFWKQHEIWHSAANETPQFLDITGDGRPELIMGSETEGLVGYLEIPSGEAVYRKWKFLAVNTDKYEPVPQDKVPPGAFRYYHGLGAGDVNGDGRIDILIPHGWWEAPPMEKLGTGPWKWHSWNLTPDGKPGYLPAADLYVDDLDLDGDNDVLMSSAHQVGVWWFENEGGAPEPRFKLHLISDVVTQTHALNFVDLNGDGQKDLVTGKRWWAHGPKGDVRPDETPYMIWFEIVRTQGAPPKITPHVISESAGTGMGTQFVVTDFNRDNLPDIIVSNKKGTNVLLQVK